MNTISRDLSHLVFQTDQPSARRAAALGLQNFCEDSAHTAAWMLQEYLASCADRRAANPRMVAKCGELLQGLGILGTELDTLQRRLPDPAPKAHAEPIPGRVYE